MTLRALFGTEFPIIQAPMASAQGSALAIAVSNAGGLGSLPCGMLGIGEMRAELAAITAATRHPFNVNFFAFPPPPPDPKRDANWRALLAPYYRELELDPSSVPSGPARAPFNNEQADVLAEFRPAVVSFHFGLPAPALLARVRGCGAKIISSATTVEEARWLEGQGVDAIIAQGLEAGGHRGSFLEFDLTAQAGTLALVRQVVRAVKLPVIAAGGIADERGVAAAMALGAAGVQVGTAYLLCPEASTSPVLRAALKSEASRRTVLTNIFSGRPARGMVNRLTRELGPMNDCAPPYPLAAAAIAPLRAKAESRGSGDFTLLLCGQNASGCREVPAAELTRSLAALL
jgi:nitronate monooxygenase